MRLRGVLGMILSDSRVHQVNQVLTVILIFLDCQQFSTNRPFASSKDCACFSIFRQIFVKGSEKFQLLLHKLKDLLVSPVQGCQMLHTF